MEKMHVSFIKDLRNYEFSLLISNIGNLIAKSESENSSLQKAATNLQSHHNELLQLKDTKPSHYLTEVINKKVHNRTEHLIYLRYRIEGALKSPFPQERVAAKRLMYWIDPYRKELFKPSIRLQGVAVKFLKHDRDKSADIQKFIRVLNLDSLLDILVDITTEIKSLVAKRVKDKTRRAVDSKEVRGAAYHDLKVLISVMNGVYNLSDSTQERDQIATLSSEINEYLTEFRRELRSRTTKSKNKRAIDVAVKELIVGEGDDKSKACEDKGDDNDKGYEGNKDGDIDKAYNGAPAKSVAVQRAAAEHTFTDYVQNANEGNSTLSDDRKIDAKNGNLNRRNVSGVSSSYISAKKEGDDAKLPPIGKN